MFAIIKRKNSSIGCQNMSSIATVLIITVLITLIDAQLAEPKTVFDSKELGDTSKRAGFLPSRGKKFWSIFDWDDSSEKRMSRFLPMRGRKAGFLPMRGKKYIPYHLDDSYNYDNLMDYYNSDQINTKTNDDSSESIDNSVSNLNTRAKKAFHAMRGKKQFEGTPLVSNPLLYSNVDKKSRNFFGMRG